MPLRLALRAHGACNRPHTQLSSTTTLAELHHETLDTGSRHGAAFVASSPAYAAVKTIVLVHGAFADGSGWKPVADILQREPRTITRFGRFVLAKQTGAALVPR